ncbi:alpha/beta fold hydrolase [Halorientalis halophila]|uniref:alpha/beta fold hydrolase n=1 Tax=Halorientalis halophila TaxID=3108499 RepID=UPI00300BEFD7
MQTVAHDGRETAYWVDGADGDGDDDGPVVCFVHGSGQRNDVWREQTGREGYTAVTLDLSGHGDSEDVDTPAGPETMDAYVRDVAAVARATDADVIAGHSLGGAVVQTLVLEDAYDPEAVVLAGTGAKLGIGEDVGAMLGGDVEPILSFMRSANVLFEDTDHPAAGPTDELMREVGMAMLKRDLSTCDTFDVRDRLDEITVPALCIVGDNDSLTPPTFSEYLVEHLPDAEYAEVPGTSHMAMLENPAAWNDGLDAFLDRL